MYCAEVSKARQNKNKERVLGASGWAEGGGFAGVVRDWAFVPLFCVFLGWARQGTGRSKAKTLVLGAVARGALRRTEPGRVEGARRSEGPVQDI